MNEYSILAHSEYTKILAKRLADLSMAMCRKRGIEIGYLSTRMSRGDNDAIHDLYDAVQNKPKTAEFLDWFLELAEQDLKKAASDFYPRFSEKKMKEYQSYTITEDEYISDPDKWVKLSLGTGQVEVKNDNGEVILILGRGCITEPDEKEIAESEQLDKELAEDVKNLDREDLSMSWFD